MHFILHCRVWLIYLRGYLADLELALSSITGESPTAHHQPRERSELKIQSRLNAYCFHTIVTL